MNDPEEKLSQDGKKSALKSLKQTINSLRLELDSMSGQFRIDDLGNLFSEKKPKTPNTIIEKLEQQKLDIDIKQKFEQMSERMNQTEQKVKYLRKKYARL